MKILETFMFYIPSTSAYYESEWIKIHSCSNSLNEGRVFIKESWNKGNVTYTEITDAEFQRLEEFHSFV